MALLALLRGAAQQEIRHAFLGDDMRDVRRELEIQLLRKLDRIELLDEQRNVLVPKRLAYRPPGKPGHPAGSRPPAGA